MSETPFPLLPVASMLTFGAMAMTAASIMFSINRQENSGNFILSVLRGVSRGLYIVASLYKGSVVLGLLYVWGGLAFLKEWAFFAILLGSVLMLCVLVFAPLVAWIQKKEERRTQPGFPQDVPAESYAGATGSANGPVRYRT